MVGKFAPNSPHSTRGLVKYVPTRGYFRAVPSQNEDKFVTSPPPPPIVERVVGCKSDYEILASLETVETVVRTQKHRLEADKFPIFSVGGPGKDFIAIWIPVGLSSGLSS